MISVLSHALARSLAIISYLAAKHRSNTFPRLPILRTLRLNVSVVERSPSECTFTLVLSRPRTAMPPVDHMQLPQRDEQPVEHAHLGPPAHPGTNHASFAEVLRQGATCSRSRQYGKRVDEGGARNPHIPALDRQIEMDFSAMFFRDLLHGRVLIICCLVLYRHLA